MTTATILSVVFNFVMHGDHTYKAIWTLDIGGHSELLVKDGDDHDTFAVVVIMIEYNCWACFESYNLPSLTPKSMHMRHYLRVHYNQN